MDGDDVLLANGRWLSVVIASWEKSIERTHRLTARADRRGVIATEGIRLQGQMGFSKGLGKGITDLT